MPDLSRANPRLELAAQHFLKTFAAVDNGGTALPGPALVAQRFRRRLIDARRIRVVARPQHDAVVVAGRRSRHLAVDDVAQHEVWFALERIAPAAAAGGAHAHNLAGQHRLAVDQAAKIARRALEIDGHGKRQPGLATVDAI